MGKEVRPLGPLALLLAKGKVLLGALLKLKFIFSLAAFMAVYWALYGAKFGIGFALLILLHEMGHFIDIKRRGLPAEMPVFMPGLGAYVRWQALGVPLETRSAISLAGPLAGLLGASICALIFLKTGDGVWGALAHATAWLNILNLIPVWILDGGQAVLALSKFQRIFLLAGALALWVVLGENVFFLVALGFAWRSFTKDAPTQPSGGILLYYAALLVSLGGLMWMLPNHAPAMR
ncbi:MAG: hypothetical protein JOY93_11325 [Acidobacteriales bacterium]|nr:hypothetical protein [Terriglobales bacterium]